MSNTLDEVKEITDFEVVPLLFHKKKAAILLALIDGEANIISLSKTTKINPGTIRRHLDELILNDLVELIAVEKNEYGQKEKYYRAVAKQFKVNIAFTWP